MNSPQTTAAPFRSRETPAPARPAIHTENLRKVFGETVAVRGLSLDVERGEVFGFLGPNGAGKSTSVKMLLGLITPTCGSAEVLGCPSGDVAARAKIGYLPEHFRFYDWLTALELLRFHGRLYGMMSARIGERAPELLNEVGLWPHRNRRLRGFSKGMMQRIGLAQALLNEPDLIFLDEPTSGLDPGGRKLVRDIIKAQRARGAAVFLNSHLLGEVEATCDRVAFIKQGRVLETRRVAALMEGEISVVLRAGDLDGETLRELGRRVHVISSSGGRAAFTVSSMNEIPEVLRFLVHRGVNVYEITPQRLSLEDLFLKIVGEDGGL